MLKDYILKTLKYDFYDFQAQQDFSFSLQQRC